MCEVNIKCSPIRLGRFLFNLDQPIVNGGQEQCDPDYWNICLIIGHLQY